jgi:hypothetical protein
VFPVRYELNYYIRVLLRINSTVSIWEVLYTISVKKPFSEAVTASLSLPLSLSA